MTIKRRLEKLEALNLPSQEDAYRMALCESYNVPQAEYLADPERALRQAQIVLDISWSDVYDD